MPGSGVRVPPLLLARTKEPLSGFHGKRLLLFLPRCAITRHIRAWSVRSVHRHARDPPVRLERGFSHGALPQLRAQGGLTHAGVPALRLAAPVLPLPTLEAPHAARRARPGKEVPPVPRAHQPPAHPALARPAAAAHLPPLQLPQLHGVRMARRGVPRPQPWKAPAANGGGVGVSGDSRNLDATPSRPPAQW